MIGWAIFGIIVVAVVVLAIAGGLAMSADDIKRYMRIRRM